MTFVLNEQGLEIPGKCQRDDATTVCHDNPEEASGVSSPGREHGSHGSLGISEPELP